MRIRAIWYGRAAGLTREHWQWSVFDRDVAGSGNLLSPDVGRVMAWLRERVK